MVMRIALVFFFLPALLAPAPASAVTVPEIVTLAKAGVSDAILIALIERDESVFHIDAEQLIALKQEGVSEPVLVAMLKSRPASSIIIVGHDPERPTGAHRLEKPASVVPFIPVVVIPYFLPVRVAGPVVTVNEGHGGCLTAVPPVAPPQVGQITTNGVGHIWTPFAMARATPVAPCERIVPSARARPHP